VIPYITGDKGDDCYHTLIISPPRCGKTTLLRDVIRQLSDGNEKRPGITVGVVDERSEIGACYMGIPQNELGIRTDVLDCCPKAKGMLMLIRSMSPRVIAVDEVGSVEDINAIEYVMNCGCKLIATVHGNSIEDIKNKPILGKLVEERLFERYVLLNNHDGVGHLEEIYDEKGNRIL
jgi:stage III sporulation protein AA